MQSYIIIKLCLNKQKTSLHLRTFVKSQKVLLLLMIFLRFTYCFHLETFSCGVIKFLDISNESRNTFALRKYLYSKVVVFK